VVFRFIKGRLKFGAGKVPALFPSMLVLFWHLLKTIVMSNSGSGGMRHLAKGFAISLLKLLAIAAAFVFKVVSVLFSSLASLMEKLSGHDGH
jgi:hypothetical protein